MPDGGHDGGDHVSSRGGRAAAVGRDRGGGGGTGGRGGAAAHSSVQQQRGGATCARGGGGPCSRGAPGGARQRRRPAGSCRQSYPSWGHPACRHPGPTRCGATHGGRLAYTSQGWYAPTGGRRRCAGADSRRTGGFGLGRAATWCHCPWDASLWRPRRGRGGGRVCRQDGCGRGRRRGESWRARRRRCPPPRQPTNPLPSGSSRTWPA